MVLSCFASAASPDAAAVREAMEADVPWVLNEWDRTMAKHAAAGAAAAASSSRHKRNSITDIKVGK